MDLKQQLFWKQFCDKSASIPVDQHSLARKLHKQGSCILKHVNLTGKRLLDVGCGFGFIDQYLLQNSDVQIIGIDFQAHLVKTPARNHRFSRVSGDATYLPFSAGSFDAVLALETLHHFRSSERAAVIAEMCRVLKPGGDLVLNRSKSVSSAHPGSHRI